MSKSFFISFLFLKIVGNNNYCYLTGKIIIILIPDSSHNDSASN